MPKTVMIVDDDATLAGNICMYLERNGWEVAVCPSVELALTVLEAARPSVIVTDYQLPGRTGIDLLKEVIAVDSRAKVVVMTGNSDTQLAVDAMKAGACDYLTKPVALRDLMSALEKTLRDDRVRARMSGAASPCADRQWLTSILGEAPVMDALKAKLRCLLDVECNAEQGDEPAVLITGETGTGKELVARALHFDGRRREGPFVEINCAAIPANLLESELFGYERGAFTDAKERKVGLVEAAEGGTLFLDEIGDVALAIQAKLLKLLEDRTVRRIGGTSERKVDVRIISATNKDLDNMVRDGRFRSDLFFRLRIISLHLPPLRERGEDVLLLARAFLRIQCARYCRHELAFAADTERMLLAYDWPGNARELKNSVEQAVLLTLGSVILPENIAFCLQVRQDADTERGHSFARASLPDARIDHLNRTRLQAAIEQAGWNIARAARLLGISRDTLRYRIRKFGLTAGTPAGPSPGETGEHVGARPSSPLRGGGHSR